jgi:uracil-DNA glycosylase
VDDLTVTVAVDSFEAWRREARARLARGTPPDRVHWSDLRSSQPGLADLSTDAALAPRGDAPRTVPRAFLKLARAVSFHRDPRRWARLYRVAWRLTHDERGLLDDDLDPDMLTLRDMSRQVARDIHKMHAFVRFRETQSDDGPHYIAWHRPDHFIARPAAAFFRERFRVMRWSILTPDESVHWDGHELRFAAGVPQSAAPQADRLEDLWRTYYQAMFNPARINPKAMTREMPRRHWATLPEARLIHPLLMRAPERVSGMIQAPSAELSARLFVPGGADLDGLRAAAPDCRGCALFQSATQVVFGEGPATARVMLIGEQPGDEEDKQGRPFVGPAGGVLSRALADAGIERAQVYLTNAVKHFSFHREGKRRIHEKPRSGAVRACRPWLEAEIDRVKPAVIVCLGATAAHALLGPSIRIQRDRGRDLRGPWAARLLVTYHPSAVLKSDDPTHADEIYQWLVADLRSAWTDQGR